MHSAIMAAMSRLFILFLIALLPLRGWTVERMVVQMGGQSAECALHMQMAMQAGPQDAAEPEPAASQRPDHQGCQSCQLCMPLAALATPMLVLTAAAAQAQPLPANIRFASADAARYTKPPIS